MYIAYHTMYIAYHTIYILSLPHVLYQLCEVTMKVGEGLIALRDLIG